MTTQQTALISQLNTIVNGIIKYRDKINVYFDDADTLTAGQKAVISTAVTNAKTALDNFNTGIQAL